MSAGEFPEISSQTWDIGDMNKSASNKRDIHKEITDKIVRFLEDIEPGGWQSPFAVLAAQGLPMNPTTNQAYNGINVPSLWIDQQIKGFSSNHWATFKQWKERGACVRKGEKASSIIFYKTVTREDESDTSESKDRHYAMLRSYSVFNADQVDGYDHSSAEQSSQSDLVKRIDSIDQFYANTKAHVHHGGTGAYYDPANDLINMPKSGAFKPTQSASASENYYATLLHELTHWTGAKHRLDREHCGINQDRGVYAFEELIAELGAAFLCAQLGIEQTPREEHAHYIKSWLQALKNDKKYVFRAAARASDAVRYINNLQPEEDET